MQFDLDGAIEETFGSQQQPETTTEETQVVESGKNTETQEKSPELPVNPPEETGKEQKDGEDGEKKAEENEKDDQKPKKNRAGDRIKKLVDRNRQMREELESIKAKISEKESGVIAGALEKPDPSKYTDVRQYDFDMGQWIAQQSFAKQRQEIEARTREESIVQKRNREIDEYRPKIIEGAKKYADFDEKVGTLDIYVTPELHAALQVEDNAADLLYFFGNHPDIADEVLSMPSYQQSRAIVGICDKIKAASKPVQAKSQAAPPVKKIQSSTPPKVASLNNLSFEEHCKMMAKVEKQKQKQWV